MRNKKEEKEPMEVMLSLHVDVEISNMPLDSLADYIAYNARARAFNKKVRKVVFPIKQCPLELHPTQRVIFNRIDQPKNPLNGFMLSNDLIHFAQTLVPGKTYDLPLMVIEHLESRGTPVWEWYDLPPKHGEKGEKETRISHYEPRFALRQVA